MIEMMDLSLSCATSGLPIKKDHLTGWSNDKFSAEPSFESGAVLVLGSWDLNLSLRMCIKVCIDMGRTQIPLIS